MLLGLALSFITYVCTIQRAAGRFSGADAALLGIANVAAWEVSGGVAAEVWGCSGEFDYRPRPIGDLGSCGFGRRGGGGERGGGGVAREASPASGGNFNDYQHRTETGGAALRG